jgi:flagellar basal-body rod modification protein FlgD
MDAITNQPAQAATASPQAARPERMISSDFETFLRMLTAQLENQDPLNPLESTDFAVQLATFSGVEQQVKTNELLTGLESRLGADLSQMAGLVGMEARVAAPVAFAGAPVDLHATPPEGAAQAEMQVRDAAGRIVDRFDIPLTAGPVAWTGVRADGSAFAHGAYSFSVVGYDAAGQEIAAADAEHYATVLEARRGEQGVQLVLDTGGTVPAGAVSALRAGTP